jgi:hypothetical protein
MATESCHCCNIHGGVVAPETLTSLSRLPFGFRGALDNQRRCGMHNHPPLDLWSCPHFLWRMRYMRTSLGDSNGQIAIVFFCRRRFISFSVHEIYHHVRNFLFGGVPVERTYRSSQLGQNQV